MIKLKRVYEKPDRKDGYRILVERLWPRGLKKEDAKVDLWMKEIAPSTELRKWYAHEIEKWQEFQQRYEAELKQKKELIEDLKQKTETGPVTLVYAAKDVRHNSAIVLKKIIERSARK